MTSVACRRSNQQPSVSGSTIDDTTAERHELHELVDELPEDEVAAALGDVRRRLPRSKGKARRRPVNPTILTPEEFAAQSAFLDNVRSGPAVVVLGELPWR